MEPVFKELFEYNHQMNQKILAAFDAHAGQVSEQAFRLMNHILNAQHIWNNRIEKQEEPYKVWQIHSPERLRAIDTANYHRTLEILRTVDFDRSVQYVNSQGNAYQNQVRDILFHAVNHSTYHRAQIATEFRRSGLEPLNTDYIAYKR